jgi:hypothetical protein
MSIIIDPEKYLNNMKRFNKIRLNKGNISLKLISFIKKYLDVEEQESFYGVIKNYKRRIDIARKKDPNIAIKDVVNDYKQAENLLDDILLYKYVNKIKKEYKDSYFIWLPSVSKVPRESHKAYYNRKFSMTKGADGLGLLPMMEYGCKCGMEII